MIKHCDNCKHLHWTVVDLYPGYDNVYECEKRFANSFLIQFPFKNTTCKLWELNEDMGLLLEQDVVF